MYFQFLIEDASAEILIGHVMGKLQDKYPEKEILFDTKSFTGMGYTFDSDIASGRIAEMRRRSMSL